MKPMKPIKPAETLSDRLAQSGHKWYADAMIAGKHENLVGTQAIAVRLSDLLLDWGIKATNEEIVEYVRGNSVTPRE